MTPDLLTANMYISIWNTENKQEVLLMLDDSMPRLRSALSKHLGKQLRRMPYIAFFLDETIDEMYRVEEMMKKVEAEDEAIRSLPKD
jgi:ribosome-binding factor A